jgi:hypothetical protein
MGHVVLLGDSIFDNQRYVPDRPSVLEQVRKQLPAGWKATLLAIDGDCVADVSVQLALLPADCTHLFVSAGGNDALGEINILAESVVTVAEALGIMAAVVERFRMTYRSMLAALEMVGKPTTVCTVYDAVPNLGPAERAALAGFNDVILREAFRAGLPVIDLRLTCAKAADFSSLSTIEPSHIGGNKIARAIGEAATVHDFQTRRSAIYI